MVVKGSNARLVINVMTKFDPKGCNNKHQVQFTPFEVYLLLHKINHLSTLHFLSLIICVRYFSVKNVMSHW